MIATMQPEPSLIKCTRQSDKRHSLVVLKIQIPEALINVLFFCAFPPIPILGKMVRIEVSESIDLRDMALFGGHQGLPCLMHKKFSSLAIGHHLNNIYSSPLSSKKKQSDGWECTKK
jgi:hypothetical protein